MGYGIDIGTSALKVVGLTRTIRGYKVHGVVRRRAPDVSTPDGKAALFKMIAKSVGASSGRAAGVVGLSGRDINLQIVQQPAMKPLNYKVMMRYELDQRKGENNDLYADFCTLREPDQYYPQYLALVGIAKSAYVNDRLELLTRASVDVRDAVPNAFALYAVHRNAYGVEGGTIMLLDIGSDNMDIAFVRGGRLIFARNVASGARGFDSNIAGSMDVSLEAAEALKIKHGDLGAMMTEDDESEEGKVRAPVRSAAGQLAGFINASINHAKLQLNEKDFAVDKIYLSGGGARLRGLPEYLGGSLKLPVELLDPFKNLDTGAVDGPDDADFKHLPTDIAVALGLAQIATPGSGLKPLSLLPDPLKKRKSRLQTVVWMGGAAAILAVTLLALTALAWGSKAAQEKELDGFKRATQQISDRIQEMDALENDLRDSTAKVDSLLAHQGGPRAALDAISKLRRILPPGITIRQIRLVEPDGKAEEREGFGFGVGGGGPKRAAFLFRGKGLIVGTIEGDEGDPIRLKGHPEAYPVGDVVGEVLKWPAVSKAVLIGGEVDENVRGGPREALNGVRDQLTDPTRGVKAVLQSQKRSDKPGWRAFEILVSAE